jgi:transposase
VNKTTTLGVDLAKNHFQSNGVDRAGKVVLRRGVRRAQLLKTIAQLEPCVSGIGLRQCTFLTPCATAPIATGQVGPGGIGARATLVRRLSHELADRYHSAVDFAVHEPRPQNEALREAG